MKILHAANFSHKNSGLSYCNTDRKLSAGFTRNGHFVYDFSCRDVARTGTVFRTKRLGAGFMNAELLRICRNIEPDRLVIGHGEMIHEDTLAQLRREFPGLKILLWYVDALYDQRKTAFFDRFAPYLDAIFVTTGGEMLRQLTRRVPVAAYLPNVTDSGVESARSFAAETHETDFVFAGSIGDDAERRRYMEALRDGLGTLKTRFAGVFEPPVGGAAYMRLLAGARMGLNYSRRNDVPLYSSDRIAQLMGNGLLTFSPRVPELELLFRDDELAYFSDRDDLIARVRYFAGHWDEGRAMAERGWRRVHAICGASAVAAYLLAVTDGETVNVPWREHIFRA